MRAVLLSLAGLPDVAGLALKWALGLSRLMKGNSKMRALFVLSVVAFVAGGGGSLAAEVQHPVFPSSVAPRQVAGLKARVEKVMGFSRAEIDQWIVAKSSFQMVACPNCEWPGGRRDRKNYWRWSVEDPERVHCTHCGAIYPDQRYPMSAVDRIVDPTGQEQEFPYYPGKDGYKYYLTGKIDNARKQYMEQIASVLASLYVGTHDARYARQAALILDRLAAAYPHYNVQICRREGSPLLLKTEILQAPEGLVAVPRAISPTIGRNDGSHYPYWSNRRGDGWNGWYYSELPTSLVYAYDAIAASDALDRLSAELGHDVRGRICGFFRDTANYARSYPIYLGNMDPTLISGFAVIGRVIGEPELVHDALRRVRLILERQFYPDGTWREGAPSYHAMTIGGLRNAAIGPLKGYSDPPGYVGRDDGLHLQDLDVLVEVPLLRESFQALDALRLPNGSYACIHDTWSSTTQGQKLKQPKSDPMPSCVHWGMGHAILGTGRQDTGLQAHLHFSGGYGHQHADTLGLILFGQGRELISDIGYTHTVLRPYACGSLAHNLVVVNGQDQRTSSTQSAADGAMIAAARLGPVVQYVEARGEGAYPGVCRCYRRALATVAAPEGGAYVLDVFRVAGGERHEWIVHGSADEDMHLSTSLPAEDARPNLLPEGVVLRPWKNEYGRNVAEGVNHSYGLLRDARRAAGDRDCSACMNHESGCGVRISLLGQPGTEVFLGRMPSVRRARQDSSRVYDFWMPMLLARREGRDVQSTFIAVHQAFASGGEQYEVAPLTVESADRWAAGVVVRGNGFVDYHLCGTGPESELRATKPAVRAVGRYAFVRVVDSRPVNLGVADGSVLEWEGVSLPVPREASGEVLAVRNQEAGDAEHALVVSAALAARPARPDERVIVRFGDGLTYGLLVKEIRREGNACVIALQHRPGFRLSANGLQAEQTHWPRRESEGRPTFHLPGVAWHEMQTAH